MGIANIQDQDLNFILHTQKLLNKGQLDPDATLAIQEFFYHDSSQGCTLN